MAEWIGFLGSKNVSSLRQWYIQINLLDDYMSLESTLIYLYPDLLAQSVSSRTVNLCSIDSIGSSPAKLSVQ